MPTLMFPVFVVSHPTSAGPRNPPRFPSALIMPRAPPEIPGGNNRGGIAQNGPCMDFVNTPVSTSSANDNHIWCGKSVANQKKTPNPASDSEVQSLRFLVLSDR